MARAAKILSTASTRAAFVIGLREATDMTPIDSPAASASGSRHSFRCPAV